MLRMSLLSLLCFFSLPARGQQVPATPDDLLEQAQTAYNAKHYNESVSLATRALPYVQDGDRAGVEYNLACFQALAGDSASAFNTLDHAVEDGYADRKSIEADKDLLSLHTSPRWQPLLERIGSVTAQGDARWGDAAFSTPNAVNLPDADKLAGLSELWAQAKYGFANFWHVPQLHWDQTYHDYIPKVLATQSTAEYYRVLQSFYALLQDGHSNVYPPDPVGGKLSRLPLRTRLIDGHLIVIGSRDPAADLQGIHLGDEVVAINAEPATAWAQSNVAPYVSASTPQDRDTRTYEYAPFLAPVGTAFHLEIQTPSGQRSNHTFQVSAAASPHRPLFELRLLPGNTAYVALNGFDDDTAAKEWDKHWPEIRKASALILDLRENGGGDDSVGAHILATLLDKPAPGELSRSTRWIASYRAWGLAETPLRFPVDTLAPDPARHFSGPVVVLISPRTYSAGEDTVLVFAQAHRGHIIGEPSGGSSGQPLQFKLPGGGTARICSKHDSFADGREFVGIGIQPDIAVHPTREDIIAGRDPVLETAMHTLQTRR